MLACNSMYYSIYPSQNFADSDMRQEWNSFLWGYPSHLGDKNDSIAQFFQIPQLSSPDVFKDHITFELDEKPHCQESYPCCF